MKNIGKKYKEGTVMDSQSPHKGDSEGKGMKRIICPHAMCSGCRCEQPLGKGREGVVIIKSTAEQDYERLMVNQRKAVIARCTGNK